MQDLYRRIRIQMFVSCSDIMTAVKFLAMFRNVLFLSVYLILKRIIYLGLTPIQAICLRLLICCWAEYTSISLQAYFVSL